MRLYGSQTARVAHLHNIDVVAPCCFVQRGVALAILGVNASTRLQQRADRFRLVLARREQKRRLSLLYSETHQRQQQ